jgi:hypothetical protein
VKYNLTSANWSKLWGNNNRLYDSENHRIGYWNSHLAEKYKLVYNEYSQLELGFPEDILADEHVEELRMAGYFGIIEGDEKDITWFLLQL